MEIKMPWWHRPWWSFNGFGSLRFLFASFLMDFDRGVITVQPWWFWS